VTSQGNHDNLVKIGHVPPEWLGEVWPIAGRMIEKSQRRVAKNVSMDDVLAELHNNRARLWMVQVGEDVKGAVVVTQKNYPQRSVLYIEHVGGSDVGKWAGEAIEMMTRAAKSAGLNAIEADGRRGWAKYMKKFPNWREVSRRFELEI
jgi:hypothetical protein